MIAVSTGRIGDPTGSQFLHIYIYICVCVYVSIPIYLSIYTNLCVWCMRVSSMPYICEFDFLPGGVTIPGAVGGGVCGGFLAKKLRMSVNQLLKWSTILFAIIAVLIGFFYFRCDDLPFAGVTVGYNQR